MGKKIASGRIDISIIIPVFNTEKYLVRCLDSIFNQQFSGSFEVIAVDDCSKDNSLQVLRKYQEREARLKIIEHETNKKQSIARASGMDIAKGDYIMHVDSDDRLLPGALENLYAKALETDADVLVYNYLREDAQGNKTFIGKIKRQLITSDKFKVRHYFYATCINKLVKRLFVNDLISSKIGVNNTEDLLYSIEILFRVGKICLVPEYYYVYFENRKSVTWTTKSESFIRSQVIILNQIFEIFSQYTTHLRFFNNVLDYFEKWIYLEMAKIHFWNKKEPEGVKNLIKIYYRSPSFTYPRAKTLELSMKNKFICLWEVTKHAGLRSSLGILKRSFWK